MRNSLTLSPETVKQLLDAGTAFVIRVHMPEGETISFNDMIRGEVSFDSSLVDDKVLLKADGMPTYHLAVVVDDYLMQISHAFRGEEWLPSAPVHIFLWRNLFGIDNMPQWAHFPLILGPHGKLSKRDGAKFGFPVYAMNWSDPSTGESTDGFKEKGFLAPAFINLLALLGWNDGTEQEIFSIEELIQKFDISRVHSAGAKFDYEKAKWFNHEWLKRMPASELLSTVANIFNQKGWAVNDKTYLEKVISLVKDRCTLLPDFIEQSTLFFEAPVEFDLDSVRPKWNDAKKLFFAEVIRNFELSDTWIPASLETSFKEIAAANQIKAGEVLMILRIMLVGKKTGPGVFEIAGVLGKHETIERIKKAAGVF